MNNNWAKNLTNRFLFFTGKGGVGKTSLAAALAVSLADSGEKVLIISTDPASNLDEVFNTKLKSIPTEIFDVPNLAALNLDPEESARQYREKMVAPHRGKLPDAVLRNIEEQFSGSCTTEIAAFDEFVRLISDDELNNQYDHLIFDTAPTGHTLRLLSLPGAWNSYLDTTTAESSCLGPLVGLQEQKKSYEKALSELSNPNRCTVVLVARADSSSLKEAARAQVELAEIGIKNTNLIINAVFETSSDDKIAKAYSDNTKSILNNIPLSLKNIPNFQVPLLSINTVGVKALRDLVNQNPTEILSEIEESIIPKTSDITEIVADLAKNNHGVILTMGKGGVGKTYVATLIADLLVKSGKKVLLTTTDPAGNLADFIQDSQNLKVEKIDPAKEIEKYTAEILAKSAATLDQQGLDLLKEDLRSPCTEEIAVFRAFADAVERGKDQFVVIDTAPTGHTILLMDATESYHREVLRTNSDAPESVKQLLPKLRDENYTKVILVTLPEPTPVHEAAHLQEDLKRAEINPYAWVINRSLLASGTKDPILNLRAQNETPCINEVLALNNRVIILPWKVYE